MLPIVGSVLFWCLSGVYFRFWCLFCAYDYKMLFSKNQAIMRVCAICKRLRKGQFNIRDQEAMSSSLITPTTKKPHEQYVCAVSSFLRQEWKCPVWCLFGRCFCKKIPKDTNSHGRVAAFLYPFAGAPFQSKKTKQRMKGIRNPWDR